jgi:tetratricopeptide (TPR) repeat protein
VGAWDDQRRDAIHDAFAKTELPHAQAAFAAVEQLLDGYAARWASARRDTCESTLVRRDQAADLYGRRMACLETRRSELAALTDLLAHADRVVLARSVEAARQLPEVADCSDGRRLLQGPPLPIDPAARAATLRVRAGLAQARALRSAGLFEKAQTEVASALAIAREVGQKAALAEALELAGDIEWRRGDADAAEASLESALLAAEASHHDLVAARTWIDLVWVVGVLKGRFDDGLRAARHAEAAIARAGSDPVLESDLLNNRGTLLTERGELSRAREDLRHAITLRESALGPDDPKVARSLGNLGRLEVALRETEAAIATQRRTLSILEKAYGGFHPDVGMALNNLAGALHYSGQSAEALSLFERALRIQEQALGPGHPQLAYTLSNIADMHSSQKRREQSLTEHRRALAIVQKALGAEHPRLALSLNYIGFELLELGRIEEARASFAKAASLLERVAPQHGERVAALRGLGEVELKRGHDQRGIATLERALELATVNEADPAEVDQVRMDLGRAIFEAGGNRSRALGLVRRARDGFAKEGPPAAAALREAEAFLRRRERAGRAFADD